MQKDKKQFLQNFILIVLCILIIVPFLIVVSVSFSSENSITEFGYRLFPKQFSVESYKYIFKNSRAIFDAYGVTFTFSAISMVLSVLLMAMIAYPLARKAFKYSSWITFYVYFTSLFSGGLVPTYILITQYLHLGDTIWVYILPTLISPWYVFMMRTFFQGIPESIIESVVIDGGNEYTIFMKFIMPLSKPVLATVSLFVFLGKWNDWYRAMLYIDNQKLLSLQYLLQRIMKDIELLQNMSIESSSLVSAASIPSETIRMAMAVVVAGPVLLIFPFFQKYFVKGLTVGAVKG